MLRLTRPEIFNDCGSRMPVFRANIMIPLGRIVEGVDDDEIAMQIGKEFCMAVDRMAEDEVIPQVPDEWAQW